MCLKTKEEEKENILITQLSQTKGMANKVQLREAKKEVGRASCKELEVRQ